MNREPLSSASAATPRARIAGRYEVQAQLGAGGMGIVSRVRDESTGRTLALKQLHASAGRAEAGLFRREYHTLVLLKHPRIVAVHDYGIDAGRPYYTMELLDGDDLRALAPLDYRAACRHLRDVASALALLSAHRLVHRDLTARNVRVTSDGRCKLIDFGALSPFGTATSVVGTPPYVPPEALRGLPMDQHADLFALGALAYYLLTRTHAFPARQLSELSSMWSRRPERPSAVVARLIENGAALSPVPKPLDELVLALLSIDRAARPQSAGEAIERLTRVAELEPEPRALAAESFLLSAALVGRQAEAERAKSLVTSTVAGSGGALCIRHAPGAGGTRLLTELSLEARLAGATVLHVDAELSRGPHGAARALTEKLMIALPVEARSAAPVDLDALGWYRAARSDRPSNRFGKEDPTSAPLAARLRLQDALERWFIGVSRSCPLVLLVDNAHELDDGTAALLSVLSSDANEHAIAVIATARDGERFTAAAAFQRFERSADVVELSGLSVADTQALAESLFGDVPNSDRLAHWLHGLSNGNPLQLMELAQYLVDNGIARYVDGTWVLPLEPPATLPSRIEEAEDRRLAEHSPDALRLAMGLSLQRGSLSLDLCVALSEAEGIDAFRALDELTSKGTLIGHGAGYRFAHKSVRERLTARLSPSEQQRVHLVLGDYLLGLSSAPDTPTAMDAGWHLLSGGDERRASEILGTIGVGLFEVDELPEAIPALEAAVAVYRKQNRPRYELRGLLHPLAFSGYYVERRLADEYGDLALQLLGEETGIALTARLSRYVGIYIALFVGLVYAVVLHFFNGRGGVRGLNNHISFMGGLTTSLTATSVICLDAEGAARRAVAFEPFEPLGLRHAGAFSSVMAKTIVGVAQDRAWETITRLRELLLRLDTPGAVVGFPRRMKPVTRGGLLYGLGVLEGMMDAPLALSRANQLEEVGLRLYDMLACQVRANYYGCQGNIELAREYEKRVEIHATRNGSTWQAEVWAPSSRLLGCLRTRDLVGLKRAGDELERLSAEIPSLEKYARAARALIAMLRNDHATAIPLLEELHSAPPRSFIGWTALSGVLGEVYNETGQPERAEALCAPIVAQLTDEDRLVASLTLDVELALAVAEARLGRPRDAEQRLDRLLRLHETQRGGITLGSLHRARAEVALVAGDTESARYHRGRMDYWFRSTNNPSLIAECERMSAMFEPPVASRETATEENTATVREFTNEIATEIEPRLGTLR
ncbi:MAG TPA: protein kinase [Polyangiaceae bacterium]|nr:protein kinase [Polyangiaceae bacterium]